MASSSCDSDLSEQKDNTTKKGKKMGRMSDVMKKMRLQSHEQGPPWNCTRLKCHEAINKEERKSVLQKFYNLSTNDEQNAYLCELITIIPVQRRRSRQTEEEAKFHTTAFSYKVRMKREDVIEIPVCYKAFKPIHGISKDKLNFCKNL
ncbi:hypothetical protein QE152_g12767 [Popillia japonica]|uniref:Uncharacterized protein n=1 Tax=Popillia japonica TaxID=7064 RepID=A0AAW1LHE7_POPJA